MEGDQANLHNETLLGDGIFLSPLQKKLFEFNTKVETYYLIPTILNLKKGCKLRLSSRGESGSGCGSLLLPGCKAAAAEQTHRRRIVMPVGDTSSSGCIRMPLLP